ncbi:MAG: hypothetical protein ACOYIK_05735 [Coriobacteriales bacterium]|jgi:hypothetical protein
MAKDFAAIGSYTAGEGEVPTSQLDPKAAFEKISELLAAKTSGDILYGDEYETVKDCLAAIGADETSVSEDGSFQGAGKISYEAEGAGVKVAVEADMSCKGVLDRTRMAWTSSIGVTKVGGDAVIQKIIWNYTDASFGVTDAEGYPNIIFKRDMNREINDPVNIEKINNGEQLRASLMDFTSFIQWGFFLGGTCTIITSEGTLVC